MAPVSVISRFDFVFSSFFATVRDNFENFLKASISEPRTSNGFIVTQTCAYDKEKKLPKKIGWKFLANMIFFSKAILKFVVCPLHSETLMPFR